MNPWVVVPALALVAVVYVLLPVGLAMSAHYRRPKVVRCPLTDAEAAIAVGRTGLAEALGRRSLRRVSSCSLWPERRECNRACLRLPEEAIGDLRVAA